MAQSKVYRGMKNPDSTCYLNAVLQTLFMTEEFKERVMSVSSDDNFIKELKELFIELEKQQKTAVSTTEVTTSLGITDVRKQADAAEHLQSIINKTPGSSELFEVTMTKRSCRSCRDKQEALQEFLSLIVSLEDSQDVEDAVKAHVDQLCGVYQMTCFRCKSNTIWERKSEIINFPEILIIQLRRFETDSSGYRKSNRKVRIRPHIKVSSVEYELYAIINHSGTYHAGHYNADIKCEDEIWRRFDDHSVSESDINRIFRRKGFAFSSDAYLLVYRRRE